MSALPLSLAETEDATALFEDIFCHTPKAVIAAPFAITAVVALCGSGKDFPIRHARADAVGFEEIMDTPDNFSVLYLYRPSKKSARPLYIGVTLEGGPK